jgi:hypothetical protein
MLLLFTVSRMEHIRMLIANASILSVLSLKEFGESKRRNYRILSAIMQFKVLNTVQLSRCATTAAVSKQLATTQRKSAGFIGQRPDLAATAAAAAAASGR